MLAVSDIGDLNRCWLSPLGPLVLLLPKLYFFWLSGFSVPDEGYSRNVPCALN